MKIIVKRPAFPQKLRREDEVAATQLLPSLLGIAHRHRRLDDHQRIRINRHHITNHRLDGAGIEVVSLGIVISGCGNDHHIGTDVGFLPIQRRPEIERLAAQVLLDLFVLDRRIALVEHLNLLGDDVQRNNLIVLSKKQGIG